MKRHPVSEQYIKEIKAALKQFGTYPYYDKGAEEVMQVHYERLFDLTQAERVQVFKELMAFKDGQPLAYAMVGELQDLPEGEWEELDDLVTNAD